MRSPRRSYGGAVGLVVVTVMSMTACNGGDEPGSAPSAGASSIGTSPTAQSSTGSSTGSSTAGSTAGGVTTTPVATDVPTTASTRTRDELIAVVGPPDAYRGELQALDGQDVLVESMVYGEIGQRFTVVGGVVTGSESIDPFPDDTLFPLQYSINELWPGQTRAEITDSLAGVELTEVDGAALDLPGATLLSAGQLVLALLDDRVIYVETFPLVPDADGTFQAYMQGTNP